MQCSNCGKKISDDTRFCSECGTRMEPVGTPTREVKTAKSAGTRGPEGNARLVYPRTPPLSPHLAWLTLIWPGIPQMVFGQTAKGIAYMLVFALSIPTLIGPLVILILAVVDAYMVGNRLRAGQPITKWQMFPG